jgi:hypothetical protein
MGSSCNATKDEKTTDVILMCKAMKTADNGAKMKNPNPKSPDKSTKIREDLLLALEWE